MAFEILEKLATRGRASIVPTVNLSTTGRLVLNQAAGQTFQKTNTQAVLLLWDAPGRTIGIQAAKDTDKRAYRLSGKRGAHGINAGSFFDRIGYQYQTPLSLPLVWHAADNMYTVDVPEDRVQAQMAGPAAGPMAA